MVNLGQWVNVYGHRSINIMKYLYLALNSKKNIYD